MAETSQMLREELRHHYSMNDLDKLNLQAEMEVKMASKAGQWSIVKVPI